MTEHATGKIFDGVWENNDFKGPLGSPITNPNNAEQGEVRLPSPDQESNSLTDQVSVQDDIFSTIASEVEMSSWKPLTSKRNQPLSPTLTQVLNLEAFSSRRNSAMKHLNRNLC